MRRTLSVLAAFLLTLAWPQARALADVPIPEIDTPLSDAALEINTTGTGNNDYLIDLTGVSTKFFANHYTVLDARAEACGSCVTITMVFPCSRLSA